MEKTEKSQRGCKQQETDFLLQWGNGKRLRCVRVRDPEISDPSYVGVGAARGRIRRKITSRFVAFSEKETCSFEPSIRVGRNSETGRLRRENNRRVSPEKERRDCEERGKEEESKKVWPKLYIGLSIKEKEEDFMAMKGCKLPHRPKKRAKIIQRSLLLVSPGAWLTDMCQERYEVREKKSSKKIHRPRGLKAMGNMESDSE